MVVHLPVVVLDPGRKRPVCSGQGMEASEAGVFRVESEGHLVARYRVEGELARPEVVLCAE